MVRTLCLSLVLGMWVPGHSQDPVERASDLHRQLGRLRDAESDPEARSRLEGILGTMGDNAVRATWGEISDRRAVVFYDTRELLAFPEDHPSRDFWEWCPPVIGGIIGYIGGDPEPPFGREILIDFLKLFAGSKSWEDQDTSLSLTRDHGLLVEGVPSLQRKVAFLLRRADAVNGVAMRGRFVFFAGARPPQDLGDTIDDATFLGLGRPAEGGMEGRRLGDVELAAMAGQVVSGFAGAQHRIKLYEDSEEGTLAAGTAVEFRAQPMLEGYRIHFKAAFTHLIRVEEVVAGKETLLLPSFAEARLGGDRWVPASRWVNLGRLGPLPAEAGLPPYVILLARFEPVR